MFSNKLKQLLKENKLTQTQLADLIKTNQGNIAKWVNNLTVPSLENIKKIAHALNVPASYFLEDIDISNPNLITDLVKVPVIGVIPAGEPIEAVEDYIDAVYVPKEIIGNKKVFGLKVQGDSMSPRIEENDYVLICPELCCDNNDIVAVRIVDSNSVTLKRFIKQNGHVILQPENTKYKPMILTDKIEILGKIIYLVRKNI